MRWPSNVIAPARIESMPVIDFKVVVLPTPLRPMSATTSPEFTSRVTPRRMREPPMSASTEESWSREVIRIGHKRRGNHKKFPDGELAPMRRLFCNSCGADGFDFLCASEAFCGYLVP